MRYLILDTETTGLTTSDHIVSLAYAETDENLNVVDSNILYFWDDSWNMNPQALNVHGLTPSFLRQHASDYETTWAKLYSKIYRSNLIAHNEKFDKRMIHREYLKLGYDDLQCNKEIDTMYALSCYTEPKKPKISLEELKIKSGISDKFFLHMHKRIFGDKTVLAESALHDASFDVTVLYTILQRQGWGFVQKYYGLS